jgi:two-component system nitrate/nitrite response regulator NarL
MTRTVVLRPQPTVRPRAASRAEPTPPHLEPIHVLVAERFPPTRTGVRIALERHGCIVTEAGSVAAVADVVSREPPDVCLIDTELAGGGVEAVSMIAQALPGTAIVMFAGSPNRSELFTCVEAGAWGYLPKEIDPSKLSVALRQVVEGEAALPRALVSWLVGELREQARRGRLPLVRDLTSREFEVLDLLSRGLTTREIAERLYVAKVTVRTHVASILRKLGVATREDAVRIFDRR